MQVIARDQSTEPALDLHREQAPEFSPFGVSPLLSGAGVVIDMPDDALGHIGVDIPEPTIGPETDEPEDLISRFARLDPEPTDNTGVKAKGFKRFAATVTKLSDFKRTRTDPLAKAALKKEGRALADVGTWDEASVKKLEDLFREVEKTYE